MTRLLHICNLVSFLAVFFLVVQSRPQDPQDGTSLVQPEVDDPALDVKANADDGPENLEQRRGYFGGFWGAETTTTSPTPAPVQQGRGIMGGLIGGEGLLGGLGSGLSSLGENLGSGITGFGAGLGEGDIMGGIGQLLGGDMGEQALKGLTLEMASAVVGGVLHGAATHVVGMEEEDDGSFTSMLKEAAGDELADQILGLDRGSGATVIGNTVGSAVGSKLDSILGTQGLFEMGASMLGQLADQTGGRLIKTVGAGHLVRKGIKGAVKGAGAGLGARRKRSLISFDPEEEVISLPLIIDYGPCPLPMMDVLRAMKTDTDRAIFAYLTILRIQCIPSKVSRMEELVTKGYLEFSNSNLYFIVPTDLDVLNKAKLSSEETELLTDALRMASFSQSYLAEDLINDINNAKNPVSVFLTGFALNFLKDVRTLAPRHFVKVTRTMVRGLRAMLTTKTKQYMELSIAAGDLNHDPMTGALSPERQTAFESVFHLAGMIHFYVNGLEPVAEGEEVGQSYARFLKDNQEEIYKRAKLYCGFDA